MSGIRAILWSCGLAALTLTGAGCGIQSGSTVMTQGTQSDPVMGTAPSTGEYCLFTATGLNPIATVRVNEGEALGFQHLGGKWTAIAGKQSFDLPGNAAQAYWKLQSGNK